MADYFSPDVDIISQGALTQGYGAVDFSLKIASGQSEALQAAAAAAAAAAGGQKVEETC
jgi:hypothetical protein